MPLISVWPWKIDESVLTTDFHHRRRRHRDSSRSVEFLKRRHSRPLEQAEAVVVEPQDWPEEVVEVEVEVEQAWSTE